MAGTTALCAAEAITILAGAGNIVENFSYTYDVLGNVLTRADANESGQKIWNGGRTYSS